MFVLNMPLLLFRVVFATLDDGGLEKHGLKTARSRLQSLAHR